VPTSIVELSDRTQERLLEGLKSSQQTVSKSVTVVAKSLESVVPSGPALSLPKGVPTSQQIVDSGFRFTLELVEAQRVFAADLLNAVSPVLRKVTGHTPKTVKPAAATKRAA
jgi:hypothetical protein